MWLVGADAANLSRPDHCHYVIDQMPDYIKLRDDVTGVTDKIVIIQIWMDPKYPDAHRDPDLRAYLSKRAMPALVRLDNENAAVVLFPPECSHDNEWHEVTTGLLSDHKEHSFTDVYRTLQEQGIADEVMGQIP
jgi:hypothetical protein